MTRAVESFEPAGEGVLFDGGGLDPFFALVGGLMVAMSVLFVWLLVRNLRIMRRVGLQPGGRRGPLAQRLAELDDLHRQGVITDAEHARARHQALTSR